MMCDNRTHAPTKPAFFSCSMFDCRNDRLWRDSILHLRAEQAHTSWGSLRAAWKKKPEQTAWRMRLKLAPADTRSSLYRSIICSSCFRTSCVSHTGNPSPSAALAWAHSLAECITACSCRCRGLCQHPGLHLLQKYDNPKPGHGTAPLTALAEGASPHILTCVQIGSSNYCTGLRKFHQVRGSRAAPVRGAGSAPG
jgi:hypothetical protein